MKSHNLKEKLQNRTITPTSNSWDKLNKKLTAKEDTEKGQNKWLFLKYAAAVLILMSAGFYFFQPKEEIKENPIIVSPTLKEEVQKLPVFNVEPKTEVAIVPEVSSPKSTIKKELIQQAENKSSKSEGIAFQQIKVESEITEKVVDVFENTDEIAAYSLILQKDIEKQTIEDEVQQLLNKSQLKLVINRQKSSYQAVNANALLLEVEDDLDKDFKQKLFDKVVKTLKNQKEVVTFREN